MNKLIIFSICFLPFFAKNVTPSNADKQEKTSKKSSLKKSHSKILSFKKTLADALKKLDWQVFFICFFVPVTFIISNFLFAELSKASDYKWQYRRLKKETRLRMISFALHLVDEKTDLKKLREDLKTSIKKQKKNTIEKYLNDPFFEEEIVALEKIA